MRIHPHLNFNGNCDAAFKFYENALGGKIVFKMTHGESPMANQIPENLHDKVMHVSLSIGDQVLQGADAWHDQYEKPQGIAVSLDIKEPAEADRVFNTLSQSGSVQMPIQETFWAHRFGMVTDQFGTPWMVNCSKPM